MASKSTILNTRDVVEAVQRLDANDITELRVYNSISDNGVTALSNSLIKNTSLTYLNLTTNPIKDEAVLKLSEDELETNKDPYMLQKKKEQLLIWIPMKLLLKATFD